MRSQFLSILYFQRSRCSVVTARSELRKVLFLAPSVCVCLCMKYPENRWTDLRQIRTKTCLVPRSTSLKVKDKGQRSRSPGTKTAVSAACERFMFGKTSLASSCFSFFSRDVTYDVAPILIGAFHFPLYTWLKWFSIHFRIPCTTVLVQLISNSFMSWAYPSLLQTGYISHQVHGLFIYCRSYCGETDKHTKQAHISLLFIPYHLPFVDCTVFYITYMYVCISCVKWTSEVSLFADGWMKDLYIFVILLRASCKLYIHGDW